MSTPLKKLHWFPVYYERFLLGTTTFSSEEVGAYFLLLMEQWDKGFIPNNPREIARISRTEHEKLTQVLSKFTKKGKKLFNAVLEQIREEQTGKKLTLSERGKNGANKRWHKHSTSIAQAYLSNGNKEEKSKVEERRGEEKSPEEIFSESTVWKESICMKHKIKMAQLPEYFKDFFLHLKTQGKEKQAVGEKMSHFDNWLRVRLSNTPKAPEQYPYKLYKQ